MYFKGKDGFGFGVGNVARSKTAPYLGAASNHREAGNMTICVNRCTIRTSPQHTWLPLHFLTERTSSPPNLHELMVDLNLSKPTFSVPKVRMVV